MPICRTVVLPSEDTNSAATPLSAHAILTPFDFACPSSGGPFGPQEISANEIIGLIETGQLPAAHSNGHRNDVDLAGFRFESAVPDLVAIRRRAAVLP